MSHEIHMTIHGKASIAYTEDEPWHGLGQPLTRGAPIEKWVKEACMDYTVLDTPVLFKGADGKTYAHAKRKVLYRSDSSQPLGVVGVNYRVVQPGEVLEFFRSLVKDQGFSLETAGVLFDGAKYWALASTGHDAKAGGARSKDDVKGYLLLATACDGTLMTTAQFTSVRVVCNNTLTAALLDSSDKIGAVKISHRTAFDAKEVKLRLGLDAGWQRFRDGIERLTQISVSDKRAENFVLKLMGDPEQPLEKQKDAKAVASVLQLFKGKARGSDMKSAKGTAWGLVNAVTEYVDHYAGKDQSNRLRMAWFYDGNILKRRAFDEALKMAA